MNQISQGESTQTKERGVQVWLRGVGPANTCPVFPKADWDAVKSVVIVNRYFKMVALTE